MKKFFHSLLLFVGTTTLALSGEKHCINLDEHPEISRQSFQEEIYTDPNLVLANYQILKDVTEVFEANDIEHWLAFGSLLGAARNKGPIRHDDDLDICVNKKDEDKLKSLKKQFEVLGYDLFYDPVELVGYKIYSKTWVAFSKDKEKKVLPFIDIFLSELQEDKYVLSMKKARDFFPNGWFHKDQIENKKRYPFGELSVWGPSNCEEYLTRRYGAQWQTIGHYYWAHHVQVKQEYVWKLTEEDLKPAQPTGPLEDRVATILPELVKDKVKEAVTHTKAFWDRFYAEGALGRAPSTFCQFILQNNYVKNGATLVDVGCGNGRDTFGFLENQIQAFGIDGSSKAIESNTAFAKKLGIESPPFAVVDVTDQQALMAYKNYDNVYARFFVHAINEDAQSKFLAFLSSLRPGAKVFLEFRTDKDPMFLKSNKLSKNEGKTTHYRRFINVDSFTKLLLDAHLTIDYVHEAQGLSVHGDDNPYLARVIAHKEY